MEAAAERREGARIEGLTRAGDWRWTEFGASDDADKMGLKRAGDGARGS